MTAESHPDPFQDAMGHGLQRAIQVASCAVTAAQVYAYQQRTQAMAVAERDERARRALATQMRAERDAARATWAPAVNADWLRNADLLQTARTWAAAMPYADRSVPWYEPTAATAMRRCEERLRDLHPYAMGRYDRLREEGAAPADAMRDAAPLFANAPRTYDRPYVPRPELASGNGDGLAWAAPPHQSQASRPAWRWPRRRKCGASRSSRPSKNKPAPDAGGRSVKPSSAPSWKPSPTCRPTSSTTSSAQAALLSPTPQTPVAPPSHRRAPRRVADRLTAHGSTTSPFPSRTSSPLPQVRRPGKPRPRDSELNGDPPADTGADPLPGPTSGLSMERQHERTATSDSSLRFLRPSIRKWSRLGDLARTRLPPPAAHHAGIPPAHRGRPGLH